MRLCKIKDCNNEYHGKGYCIKHYNIYYNPITLNKVKIKIQKYFGGKCKSCKETDIDVLTIDHINNDGYKEKYSGHTLYIQILKQIKNKINVKKKYQLLCFNCNIKKRVIYQELIKLEKLEIPPF